MSPSQSWPRCAHTAGVRRGTQPSRIGITSTAFPVSQWGRSQAARPETKLRSHRNH